MIEIRETNTFKKWFRSLRDKRAQARIAVRIKRISLGNYGDVEPVGGGVSELVIDYGPGYRVYFIERRNCLVILLCGGDKSKQYRDIRRAIEMADLLKEERS